MAGYDLKQVLPQSHNPDCPCRTCKPSRAVARRCRICGAEFDGPIADAMKVATAKLERHLANHTRDEIVRVYVLGEPWWTVVGNSAALVQPLVKRERNHARQAAAFLRRLLFHTFPDQSGHPNAYRGVALSDEDADRNLRCLSHEHIVSHRDMRLAESYLRFHATSKNWPRLAEIADLLSALREGE